MSRASPYQDCALFLEAPRVFERPNAGEPTLWRGLSDVRVSQAARKALTRLRAGGFRLVALFPERLFDRELELWRKAAIETRLKQHAPIESVAFFDPFAPGVAPWAQSHRTPPPQADGPGPDGRASAAGPGRCRAKGSAVTRLLLQDEAERGRFDLSRAVMIAYDLDLRAAARRFGTRVVALHADEAPSRIDDHAAPTLALAAARLLAPRIDRLSPLLDPSLLDHAPEQQLKGGGRALLEEGAAS